MGAIPNGKRFTFRPYEYIWRTSGILEVVIWKIQRKGTWDVRDGLKIVGIIVTSISTIVRIVDMLQKSKGKHQKSNRPTKD